MRKGKIESNIWKLHVIQSISSFMLFMPVIVLFFKENGLSMKEIFLLQALFSLAVIFMEIPTGYFADTIGRKKALIAGALMATAGFIIYSISHHFWSFLLAEIVLGFGFSFISGTDSALLYDTLIQTKSEDQFKKIEGRKQGFGLISESVASVFGGFLALISLRFPLYCDVLVFSLAIPFSISLIEPERKETAEGPGKLKKIFEVIRFSLHEQKQVKWLTIYSSVVGASTLTMVWFIQPCLVEAGVPLEAFGIFWAVLMLVSAFFSWNAHKVEKKLGKKKSLIGMLLLPVVGYFLLSSVQSIFSTVFILLFYVTRGLNNPITLDYINGMIPSETRATILSIKNLVGRMIFSVVGPVVGWASDACSLNFALTTSGAIFLILGTITLILMKKHKAF